MAEENKPAPSSSDILDKIIVSEGKIDNILTMLKTILKKHWGIILFLLFCGLCYYIWNMPDVPQVEPEQTIQTEQFEQGGTDNAGYSEEYTDSTATEE